MDKKLVIYTVEQVAKMFKVKEITVREWARTGKLPGKKIGQRWVFLERDILAELDKSNPLTE